MYIKKIIFLNDYIIKLVLNGGYSFFYDLKPQMNTLRFRQLRNQDFFNKGRLEDGCRIVWDEDMKLEDYELLGFEIFESNLYVPSKNKYNMQYAAC